MTQRPPLTQMTLSRRATLLGATAALFASAAIPVAASQRMPTGLSFASIDGGDLRLDDWAGRPVLVVNTASLCGFTDQYAGLQTIYDRYREAGLIVLAIPSGDFRQELDSAAEVAEFCTLTYGLDLPMTDITSVRGRGAHPLYAWLRAEHGFTPRWNFNKVLIAGDGAVLGTWGSNIRPTAPTIVQAIEAALAQA